MSVLTVTAYLPSIRYMAKVMDSDEIIIESFETYTKQTCRNHCMIFGPNGRQTLSIPVTKTNGNHTLTRDIRISEHQPWQKIHWRSIVTAYNNSPFFLYYQDIIMHFYDRQYKFLLDLNLDILRSILAILKIDINVSVTEKFDKFPENYRDMRAILGDKHLGTGMDYPHYMQVFESRHGFIHGLSILDLLFNQGPEASCYLNKFALQNSF